jgi:hypothetical protein
VFLLLLQLLKRLQRLLLQVRLRSGCCSCRGLRNSSSKVVSRLSRLNICCSSRRLLLLLLLQLAKQLLCCWWLLLLLHRLQLAPLHALLAALSHD